ncbi:MAG: hypothetical protein B1H11_08840 [Desulfobacteraceae bacterium 4484_190.1]|nr:MAG: hypothetical protein B1H11_08840 [Desulfobacteraceae bacterium 4484_190.1]
MFELFQPFTPFTDSKVQMSHSYSWTAFRMCIYEKRVNFGRFKPEFGDKQAITWENKGRGRNNIPGQTHRFRSGLFDLKAQKLQE